MCLWCMHLLYVCVCVCVCVFVCVCVCDLLWSIIKQESTLTHTYKCTHRHTYIAQLC